MSRLALFVSGLLFAVGLGIAGMTDANKVIGFLDESHGWDPSLGLVMAGALAVHLPLYRWASAQAAPRFVPAFDRLNDARITPAVIAGSALFGAGWGLGGFCPGPALVSAAALRWQALVFVAAMTGGILLYNAVMAARSPGGAVGDVVRAPDS